MYPGASGRPLRGKQDLRGETVLSPVLGNMHVGDLITVLLIKEEHAFMLEVLGR